jgi:hypothetical protein
MAPVNSAELFLQDVIGQFGIGWADATADELQRLFTVVLRQAARRGTPVVLVIADVQDFGPRALEMIREVVRAAYEVDTAPLVVFTGNAGVNRVLDSPGMASIGELTRRRWDLDQPDGANLRIGDVCVPLDASSPERSELIVSREDEIIGQFVIDRDRMLIGRSDFSDICLPGRYISRQHALLLQSSDGLWLIDLNSTNGTIVNSQFVNRCRIANGDLISLGGYQMRVGREQRPAELAPDATGTGEDLSRTVVMRSLHGIGRPAATGEEPDYSSADGERPTAA